MKTCLLRQRRGGFWQHAAKYIWQQCLLEPSRTWAPRRPETGNLKHAALWIYMAVPFWFRLLLTKSPACRVVSSGEAAAKGTRQGSNLESRRAVPQLLSWQHVARRLYTQYLPCWGRCWTRVIALHLGIGVLEVNSDIAQWCVHMLHPDASLLHRNILLLPSPNHFRSLIDHVLGCESTVPIIGQCFLLRPGLALKHLNTERLSTQHGKQCKTTDRFLVCITDINVWASNRVKDKAS